MGIKRRKNAYHGHATKAGHMDNLNFVMHLMELSLIVSSLSSNLLKLSELSSEISFVQAVTPVCNSEYLSHILCIYPVCVFGGWVYVCTCVSVCVRVL